MMKWTKVYLLMGVLSSISAIDVSVHNTDFGQKFPAPWFTGPILAPSGYVVQPGHYNIQPYIYCSIWDGFYDAKGRVLSYNKMTSNLLVIPLTLGIAQKWNVGIAPGVVAKSRQDQHSIYLSDWVIGASYQLLNAQLNDRWPAVKLNFKAVIPLGRYQHLNPRKLKTDATGEGAWWGSVGLHSTKLWHLYQGHYLELRAAVNYFIPLPVVVHGYNTYGGSWDTDAKIYNGHNLFLNVAVQYNLSQNWALACDVLYQHKNKTRYTGFGGTSLLGTPLSLTAPPSDNLSLAPAIEYNFNANIGLLAGCWLSVLGYNSVQFKTAVLSLNIYR